MRFRSLWLLALLVCLGMSSGCSIYYGFGKITGLMSPPPFVTPPEVPPDFHLSVDVRDVADPPTDYVLEFDRDTKASYDVTVRAPHRRQQAGPFEITEDQVQALWKAVRESKFEQLAEHEEGKEAKYGVQKYYVLSNGAERRVESYYQSNSATEIVRKAALALVPPEVMKANGGPGRSKEPPKEFIGDELTHLFHRPDCPKLKDVAPSERRPFPTSFDALNFHFDPCPDCDPLQKQSQR